MPTRRPRRPNLTKFKIATAAVSGFLVGSVGLASAGTLPAPAQGVAHSVLKTVGVDVPPGHDRFNDPAACPDGPYRNHGAYVRAHKDDPNAGTSPCGKPNRAVQGADDSDDATDEAGKAPGHGPPPWSHGNGNGPKEDKDESEKRGGPGAAPSPTTTAPMAPTTTAPPPTTTPPTTTTAPATTTTSQP
jgi:hypothetical protein